MTPKLIGITGYARHGKGSVAKVLEARGYTVLSFAEPVKRFLLALNPLIETNISNDFYGRSREIEALPPVQGHYETPYSRGIRLSVLVAHYGSLDKVKDVHPDVRALLQRLGTDAAKPIFGNDCWARRGINKAHKIISEGGKVCFDDVRFPIEEGEAILGIDNDDRLPDLRIKINPQIWRVTRIDSEGKPFDNGIDTDHPSESQVKNFVPDEEILNDGSLDDLAAKIDEILGVKATL